MNQLSTSPPTPDTKILMSRWLGLALAAIFISLVYALILVLARSGYYAFLPDGERGFRTALVLHVNFSLLVWFMAFAALLWSWFCSNQLNWLGQLGWWTAVPGVLILALSPFLSFGPPIMSDYIPVLQQQAFYFGLGFFSLGVVFAALRTLMVKCHDPVLSLHPLRMAIKGSASVTLLAVATFSVAYFNLPQTLESDAVPGYLFWGAGHLLQINHLLLLLFCLMWMGIQLNWWQGALPDYTASLLLFIVLCAVPGPFIHLLVEPLASGHIPIYTGLMEATGLLGLVLLMVLYGSRKPTGVADQSADYPAIFLIRVALFLFVAGSIGGLFITSNNALVPAHYHGVIGAVTLIYMGIAYRLMPLLGYRSPAGRMICWQVSGYGVGILLLMAGLLVSDVPRKALGGTLDNELQLMIGRGLMGLGGGLALLASLLFVALFFWQLIPVKRNNQGIVSTDVEGANGRQ